MKNFKKCFLGVAMVAMTLFAFSGNAGTRLIEEGWYQIDQSSPTPQRVGERLEANNENEAKDYCELDTSPNCVAEFEANGDMVSGSIITGDFAE